MPPLQTAEEIRSILERLHAHEIVSLKVFGINSLKSVAPSPDELSGEKITGSDVTERTFRLHTTRYSIAVDLQRTGIVAWLDHAEPYDLVAGMARSTVRLLVAGGSGVTLTEPTKTKRITVTLSNGAG